MTIEVAGLSKSFTTGRRGKRREVEAVRDLSFVAEAGERLHRLGDQDVRAHEDQRGDGGGYAGGPAATLLVPPVWQLR